MEMNIVVAELERPVASKSEFVVHSEFFKSHNETANNYTLHVSNLRYYPAHQYFRTNLEELRYQLSLYNMAWLLPFYNGKKREKKILGVELHCINFKVSSGELVGILGNNSERSEIIQLLTGRKMTGTFDGHISLSDGEINDKSYYYLLIAFVQKKALYIPGLTYIQMLRHSAELKMPSKSNEFREERVKLILSLMKLEHCRNRKIPDFPPTRGELGCDLRKLSIAMEIVALPPLIVIDEPTLNFEATTSIKIIECLHNLAKRGHIVVCSMSKPSSQEFNVLDRVVLVSDGYSIFSSSPSKLDEWFTSSEMGYERKKFFEHVDFAVDICSGIERPVNQRTADLPIIMQEKYERSHLYQEPITRFENIPHAYAFDPRFFRYYGYSSQSNYTMIERLAQLKSAVIRVFRTKLGDRVSLGFYCSMVCVLAPLVGYLQWKQGHSDHNYCASIFGVPYRQTLNQGSLLFFICGVTTFMFFQDAHSFCKKVQLFRYERDSRCSNVPTFMIAAIASEVPFGLLLAYLFGNIIYYMTDLMSGEENYSFFISFVLLNTMVGLSLTMLYTVLFRKEIVVRDMFFFSLIVMVLLSGFPFPLPNMPRYLLHFSQIIPIRWSFEAIMTWFYSKYIDGDTCIKGFGYTAFDRSRIFEILRNFIIAYNALTMIFLLPPPQLLQRMSNNDQNNNRKSSTASIDSDFGTPSMTSRNTLPGLVRNSSMRMSESILPVVLMRASTVTGRDAKLSLNLSQKGEINNEYGPTIMMKNITYRIKDSKSPVGYRTILKNVCAQFSYGKLTMILGAPQSGKSSLLHIIAGNIGARTFLDGSITFNGKVPDLSQPLWERCGFVTAINDHFRDLTVREVITYAMQLRCFNHQGFSVLDQNVKTTIENLHLDDVADKKVKLLNKGEYKRLSIGEEIVHGPKLLLLDEPTTGISLVETAIMLQVFREMVNNNRTIVATMYQPTQETFNLFDSLLLLSKGRVIYSGRANKAHEFFIHSPFNYFFGNHNNNAADFLVDISGAQLSDSNGEFITSEVLENYYLQSDNFVSLKSRLKLINPGDDENITTRASITNPLRPGAANKRLEDVSIDMNALELNLDHQKHLDETNKNSYPLIVLAMIELYYSCMKIITLDELKTILFKRKIIFRRAIRSVLARPELINGSILIHTLLAIAFGWVLEQPDFNCMIALFGIGSMFLIMANLHLIFFLYNNHLVFLKEHARGLYTTYTSHIASSIPLYFLASVNGIIFGAISYGILANANDEHNDLKKDSGTYGFVVFCFMMLVLVGVAFSEIIIYISNDRRSCYVAVPSGAFAQFTASGLFLKAQSSPSWMRPWFPSISVIRWIMQACYINCYHSSQYISQDILLPTEPNPISTTYSVYDDILIIFGWGGKSKWYCFGMIVLNFFIFRMISLFVIGYQAFIHKGTAKALDDRFE